MKLNRIASIICSGLLAGRQGGWCWGYDGGGWVC